MRKEWQKTKLEHVLRYRKDFITIDDLSSYRRPRVQLHAQGIVLRDEVSGALIKTKAQQVCRSGEFLVAEIDAKVGGFGIVPELLNGSIVSSHYFLFVIDETKLDRRFLNFFIRTPAFCDQVAAQGSTNYSAIRPADVLHYEIPLPSLAEQRLVVERIEKLAAQIHETRALREKAIEETESFVISNHVHLAGARVRRLGDIMVLDEDAVPIQVDGSYPQVGVRGFGGGLFPKSAVSGTETTYRAFNRLFHGAVVLSQVKAWEGALAVCPRSLAGWYVSPEYRTFRCIDGEAKPSYLTPIVGSQWFWGRLAHATRGVGARRERTRPEQFLDVEIPMPDWKAQERGERIWGELAAVRQLQAETVIELDALLPAILDRAFKGEL